MGNVLEYEKILNECGVGEADTASVAANLFKLEEFYTFEEMIDIYNYCLLHIKDYDLLTQIVKLTDMFRNSETYRILLDIIKEKPPENPSDQYINFRAMCIKAAVNYKDTSLVFPLLACMNNKFEHYRIRLSCADALGRIGDKYAVKPLIDVVEDEEEKSVYLKESATFALGLLGDSSAIDPLISILESKQGILDKFSFLKEKIVEALGKLNINNKKVLKALKTSLMDSSPMVRINAIEGIMNSEDENSAELIRPCLQDEDDEVKRNALVALYNLCGRDILDEVIELPIYSEFLKSEAKQIMDEYESEDTDEG